MIHIDVVTVCHCSIKVNCSF